MDKQDVIRREICKTLKEQEIRSRKIRKHYNLIEFLWENLQTQNYYSIILRLRSQECLSQLFDELNSNTKQKIWDHIPDYAVNSIIGDDETVAALIFEQMSLKRQESFVNQAIDKPIRLIFEGSCQLSQQMKIVSLLRNENLGYLLISSDSVMNFLEEISSMEGAEEIFKKISNLPEKILGELLEEAKPKVKSRILQHIDCQKFISIFEETRQFNLLRDSDLFQHFRMYGLDIKKVMNVKDIAKIYPKVDFENRKYILSCLLTRFEEYDKLYAFLTPKDRIDMIEILLPEAKSIVYQLLELNEKALKEVEKIILKQLRAERGGTL